MCRVSRHEYICFGKSVGMQLKRLLEAISFQVIADIQQHLTKAKLLHRQFYIIKLYSLFILCKINKFYKDDM